MFRVTGIVLLNGSRHPEKRRRSAVQDLSMRVEIESFRWESRVVGDPELRSCLTIQDDGFLGLVLV